MSSPFKKFVFNAGATLYDILTYQETWRKHSQKLTAGAGSFTDLLDVGCGPGISSFALKEKHPEARITGVDVAEKMLERARSRKRQLDSTVDFVLADAGQLPFGDDRFDVTTGHSFLYLLDDASAVLREIGRVLRPGGRVAFLEPRAHPGVGWFAPALRRDLRFFNTMIGWQISSFFSGRFEQEEIEPLFTNAGFDNVTTTVTLNGLGWIVRAEQSP